MREEIESQETAPNSAQPRIIWGIEIINEDYPYRPQASFISVQEQVRCSIKRSDTIRKTDLIEHGFQKIKNDATLTGTGTSGKWF